MATKKERANKGYHFTFPFDMLTNIKLITI